MLRKMVTAFLEKWLPQHLVVIYIAAVATFWLYLTVKGM